MTTVKSDKSADSDIPPLDPDSFAVAELEYIPLGKLKSTLTKTIKIRVLKFKACGYVTDAVLQVLLQAPKEIYAGLRVVDLEGCDKITDQGIAWLAQIITSSKNSSIPVNLDGCVLLTDRSVALLLSTGKKLDLSLRCTELGFAPNHAVAKVVGSGLLNTVGFGNFEVMKKAGLVIVPSKESKASLTEFLVNKRLAERKTIEYTADWSLADHTFTITELDMQQAAFNTLIPINPSQVIIPFEASADLQEAKTHLLNTLAHITARESPDPFYRSATSDAGFISCHRLCHHTLTVDGLLTNVASGEAAIGVFVSRGSLTRSHPYFEVEAKVTSPQLVVLLGVTGDDMYMHYNLMRSSEPHAGTVSVFPMQSGERYGFGIQGDWLSEYITKSDCSFYFTKNGLKTETSKERVRPGMYPVISILSQGDTSSTGTVHIMDLATPPPTLIAQWEESEKYFEVGDLCNAVIDDSGTASYREKAAGSRGSVGWVLGRTPITARHNKLIIEIVDRGKLATISVGVVSEVYPRFRQPGWEAPSLAYHGDDGKIFRGSGSGVSANQATNQKFKTGDVIEVEVLGLEDGQYMRSGSTVTVRFLRNRNLVHQEKFMFTTSNPGMLAVFAVGFHSVGEKARILQYRPTYHPPVADPKCITAGRFHHVDIVDSSIGHRKESGQIGLFMGKGSLGEHNNYFEMKVTSVGKGMAIGLCWSDYPLDYFLGSLEASIGYLSNGNIMGAPYLNTSSESYTTGDMIGCGILLKDLKFREDGSVQAQQKLLVYFTKNGQKVAEVDFEHLSGGLLPAVCVREGAVVQLANFQPEITSSPSTLLKPGKDTEDYGGCKFVVVGLGRENTDASGKIKLLQEQLKLEKDLVCRTALRKGIKETEKCLGELDLNGQRLYSNACGAVDRLSHLIDHPQRISFVSINLTTAQGHDDLVKVISTNQESWQGHREYRCKVHGSVLQGLDELRKLLSLRSVITLTDFLRESSITDAFTMDGRVCKAALTLLHSQGRLILAEIKGTWRAIDTEFIVGKWSKLTHCTRKEAAPLGPKLQAWNETDTWKACGYGNGKLSDLGDLVLESLMSLFGVVRVPCLRIRPKDPKNVYLNMGDMDQQPVTLSKFLSFPDQPAKCLMSRRKIYALPHVSTTSCLSVLLNSCMRVGRLVWLGQDGAVLQLGAVQVILAMIHSPKGLQLVLEAKCFCSRLSDGGATERFVEEHIWSCLCVYSDLIEDTMERLSIPCSLHVDPSSALALRGSSSVGFPHQWHTSFPRPGDQKISVCTLCNKCCDKGENCDWNGIMGSTLQECGCGTSVRGCADCGICKRCAKYLWDVRTRLHPHSNRHDPATMLPLDIYTVNQFELVMYDTCPGKAYLYLKSPQGEGVVKVFPGRAMSGDSIEKIRDHLTQTKVNDCPSVAYTLCAGDVLKVTLEPGRQYSHEVMPVDAPPIELDLPAPELKYYYSRAKHMSVWQETGLLVYDSPSPSFPVAQFIGARPVEDGTRFGFEIIERGKKGTLSLGLVGKNYRMNQQPGWTSGSAGYHADDGGIYLSSGSANIRKKTGKKGDKFECLFHYSAESDNWFVSFFHNGEEQYTTVSAMRPGELYPCIGLHSLGEVARLLTNEPFLEPKTAAEDIISLTRAGARSNYRESLLWISPGDKLVFPTRHPASLLMHNPSRNSLVLAEVALWHEGENDATSTTWKLLNPGESVSVSEDKPRIKAVSFLLIRWGEVVSEDKMTASRANWKGAFLSHRIELSVDLQDVVLLQQCTDTDSRRKAKNSIRLGVYKNERLVDAYWLPKENYYPIFVADQEEARAVINIPAYPTKNLPTKFMPGMQVLAKISGGGTSAGLSTPRYAQCIITHVYSGPPPMLTLRYSSEEEITLPANSTDIHVCTEGLPKGADLITELSKPDLARSIRIFPAPTYLFSEDQLKGFSLAYKMDLADLSKCISDYSRPAVQLFEMAKLQIWTLFQGEDTSWDIRSSGSVQYETFAYLPSKLETDLLCYPDIHSLFSQLAVHRLCCHFGQLHALAEEGLHVLPPSHFINSPGLVPATTLSPSLLFSVPMTGWAYLSLIVKPLKLPAFDKMMKTGETRLSREVVEALLTSMLRTYAAVSCVLAEAQDGLPFMIFHEQAVLEEVKEAIRSSDIVSEDDGSPLMSPSQLVRVYREKESVVCKAHLVSFCTASEVAFDYSLFEPYLETVNALHWQMNGPESFPQDFYQRFSGLEFLKLSNCKSLAIPPENLSKCSQLKYVRFSEMSWAELPSDIAKLPSLVDLEVHDLLIKELPSQWPSGTHLTHLTLSRLLMETIPGEICNLRELMYLKLEENPITNLPQKFGQLQKLKYLNISGVKWMVMWNDKVELSKEQFKEWHNSHPQASKYLSEQHLEKLFVECDVNNNGILDIKEIAQFNVHLFLSIPRLGLDDINDEAYGGVPAEILELVNLQELHLTYLAITHLPSLVGKLGKLRVLNVHHNPLLENLPGELGLMTSVKSIRVHGCPSLRTPPNEVVSRGTESIRAYLKRLKGGFTECRRTKLMLVGLGGAGKTSLLRALKSVNKKTVESEGEQITDGIDIETWTVTNKDDIQLTYSTWDFAGQTVYYNTHQFFLSKRSVYLLLWNTRLGFEHAGLDFWLSSISCHAPKTPIFVVGTHVDKVPKCELPMDAMRKVYPQIVGFHFVSSVDGLGIAELESQLIHVTLDQKYMGEKIPKVWLNLEKKILRACSKSTSVLDWKTVENFCMDVGIYDEKDIKQAVQFLHDLGTVQYFDNDFLKDQVVINPQWIVNVMARVVTVKNSPIQDGKFCHADIPVVWSEYPENLHSWLLSLTEEFDLTFPLLSVGEEDKVNIVPCLLPQIEPEFKWPDIEGQAGIRETKMIYKFTYLPAGLFNRAQVRLFHFSDGKDIWKRGSFLRKNKHLALIRQNSDTELVVMVQGPRPENILFLIHEVFESLVEENFKGVHYDFYLPCPDCISKEGTKDPALFEADLVRKAMDQKAPFLQCRKYFHTISMAQLQAAMPSDGSGDFDSHLQRSITALQDLSSALTTDAIVLYTPRDVPGHTQPKHNIQPRKIRDDLVASNYVCWFSDDMTQVPVEEVTMAIKNSKVVVTLVSDEFERDRKCRDLFLYAADQLAKQYLIVCVGDSLLWQKTNLGMRIGAEAMIMMRSLDKYTEKVIELKQRLKKCLSLSKTVTDTPVCFLSYCWANSRRAKSHRGSAMALGWGDPRDIKDQLEARGISCWLDIEQTGRMKGLFADITYGLKDAKVIVACVSDEYLRSDNCMMELRFAVLTLNKPLVIAVVGTGREWKTSEIGMLILRARASKVYFQQENDTSIDTLVGYVKNGISVKSKDIENSLMKEQAVQQSQQLSQKTDASVSFQEEYELIQRKFMRQIISFISKSDPTPCPRLLVLDFLRSESRRSHESSGEERSTLVRPKLKPKTSSKMHIHVEAEEGDGTSSDWEDEMLCIKVLCEYDGGWHVCPKPITITFNQYIREVVTDAAPYLARIYTILKQSSLSLNCFHGSKGDQLHEFIQMEAYESTSFLEAYLSFRQFVMDIGNSREGLEQLDRCHLPSGKVSWLCEKHQKGPRITKLGTDVTSGATTTRVLYDEDTLLKEVMEKSEVFIHKRAQPVTKRNLTTDESTQGVSRAAGFSDGTDISSPRKSDRSDVFGITSDKSKPESKQPSTAPKPTHEKAAPKRTTHQNAASSSGQPARSSTGSVKFKATGQPAAASSKTAEKKSRDKNESKACLIM